METNTSHYSKLWLDYKPIESLAGESFSLKCEVETDAVISNALCELTLAFSAFSQNEVKTDAVPDGSGFSVLLTEGEGIKEGGYRVEKRGGRIAVSACDSAGFLYGSFALIRKVMIGDLSFDSDFALFEEPKMPLRIANHWDNIDGSIERGYAGNSFFFEHDELIITERIHDYARLMSSVGYNAVAINNVNVRYGAEFLPTAKHREKLKQLSEMFAEYEIKLILSVCFASPAKTGSLDTADPCDPSVIKWWEELCRDLFSDIPNLGGFLLKADSEGRRGPFSYGRTHVEGANMLARVVKPYGGLIIWRCFVYNCQQDWRDNQTDRAAQSYQNFIGLDGQFEDNVILQIKNGPVDFQTNEPVHPLIGGLKKTNIIVEFQIAQEYTGQQKHVFCMIPRFKEILDFKTCGGMEFDRVKEIVSGANSGSQSCGVAAVMNTGDDYNWTGRDLAGANLYGFGWLAYNPDLSADEILTEWANLTFGSDDETVETVLKILEIGTDAYDKYTDPLGIGWMVNPGYHFGPNVDGYEYSAWGTYHRISHSAAGRDRTENGTGFVLQYPEPLRSLYSNMDTCPDKLLLFFHRVRFV